MGIAIVVLTHDRVHILRQCVEKVLDRTSELTQEIIIWNNASSDGTRAYLDTLDDPRLRVLHSDRNIGPNAYDRAFAQTTSEYLVELDDDVIDAPHRWDATLLEAYLRLPDIALLGTNLVNNPFDETAQLMYGRDAHLYRVVEQNGVELKVGGPVGGWCALMQRSTYTDVGGFGQNSRLTYWSSDSALMDKLEAAGLEAAYLNDLQVTHAGGEYYAPIPTPKREYYAYKARRLRRRNRVKRILLRLPLVRTLNEKHAWFVPP